MCNNRPENIIIKKEKERKVKGDSIKEWIEDRPQLARKNAIAKKRSLRSKSAITYRKNAPLYLNDGTCIYSIVAKRINSRYSEISIEYSFKDSKVREIKKIKRYNNDSIEEIEQFFGNCQSIYQNYNIDLNFKQEISG